METDVIWWLLHSRNGNLVFIFIGFAGLQFIFALLYYRLFLRDRDNFTFNSDILRSQRSETGLLIKSAMVDIREAIEILKEALAQIENGVLPIVSGWFMRRSLLKLPSGRSCRCYTFVRGTGLGGGIAQDILSIRTIRGSQIASVTINKVLETAADWKAAYPSILNTLQMRLNLPEERLATLATETPDVWSYWDFLYFSTIVQTTVGFGDILPNRTSVRVLVTAQIMLGYAILIVVLNIILS